MLFFCFALSLIRFHEGCQASHICVTGAPGFREEPGRESRIGFHSRRCRGFLPGHELQGRAVQQFSMPPKKQDFGGVLAQFVDSEGAHCSVGAEAA